MWPILTGTALLLLATLVLGSLLRLLLWLARRRPHRYWRRLTKVVLLLIPVHLFLTLPAIWGWMASRQVETRSDEQSYRGPLLLPDGSWLVQTRHSVRARRGENNGGVHNPPTSACILEAHFSSRDGVPLRAFVVPPKSEPPRASAVLVHGLFRGALETDPVGALFHDLGCEVMLLELRNHGGSGRAPCTYGLHEAGDVEAAASWLREQPARAETPLLLFGISLGSTAVSLAAPRIERLSGLILDSPPEDLLLAAHRLLSAPSPPGRRTLTVPQPFRSIIFTAIEFWSGFRMADVRPVEALQGLPAAVPVLLIGGGQDRIVPREVLFDFAANLPTRPDHKRLWISERSEHGSVLEDDREGYRAALASFLDLVR